MLNVRIDSLPSDRKTALKSCSSCDRRRIKCDRTLPQCRKCTIRGIQCPGFNSVRLKWGQGVASRGPLAGRNIPVQHASAESITLSVDTNSRLSAPIPSPTRDCGLVDSHSRLILSHKLFAHFNVNVAPRLTWIDSPDHPWRKIVVPLAQRCPSLSMAILSAAAAHLLFTSTGDVPDTAAIETIGHHLRDTCIRDLTKAISAELEGYTRQQANDSSFLVQILATTLVLCYREIVVPDSTDWSLHLHACRILIERQKWRGDRPGAVAAFLIKEVADLEVFRSIGTFTTGEGSSTLLLPQSIFGNHFRTFTGLIYEITAEERRRHELAMNHQHLPQMNMNIWQIKARQACNQASADTTWLASHGEHMQNRVNALIQAYYYTTLIYSYQALAPLPETAVLIQTLVSQLFDEIEVFTADTIHIISHNIFLPLFIAGTESWADSARQGMIERLFQSLVSATGVWCNYSAMHFLRAFWARAEYHGIGKWIQYARENERGKSQFLIF
ncbi:hypothetical protein ASPWEDRAFT_164800 [Aspergillus wentii DTO 134E9]|uniref:Zn(2)-C6 fungal-type domain-containing protein n=1 Tax=Aspergillus wentii DTO 134E9 TaxID=1073089 RepID=A0A1L9R6K1_ASPWE|nr:uncharacterized protein ASPWEDRAFT_164800 [Aspergillus wentii DTO 134E9]OJJ30540.1 hypothetical protein ASPWEDRAFT_164800 [Aspergillus wentii DTO 134E9]